MNGNHVCVIRRLTASAVASVLLSQAALMCCGCAAPFPKSRGRTITRPLDRENPGYHTTLQIHWLGTTCYLIQLGDVAILTDPFVSYYPTLKVAFGTIESDPEIVDQRIRPLPVADAVFVGHSHYDHMLDLEQTLQLTGWRQVPVVGSPTTRNILCGYDEAWTKNWQPAETDGDWRTITPGLEYLAILAQHAPNIRCCGSSFTVWPGKATECLDGPPRSARDFPMGETYTYVFKLSNAHVANAPRQVEFTIYFAGAASNEPVGFPPASVQDVDLAILCVPGWTNVSGYPEAFIERLRPRNLLLAHYDNFLERRSPKSKLVPTAHLNGFLRAAQAAADYPEMERILVPDVGAIIHIRKP